jgi:hypothetical protein
MNSLPESFKTVKNDRPPNLLQCGVPMNETKFSRVGEPVGLLTILIRRMMMMMMLVAMGMEVEGELNWRH